MGEQGEDEEVDEKELHSLLMCNAGTEQLALDLSSSAISHVFTNN